MRWQRKLFGTITAIAVAAAIPAHATILTYSLNGSYAEDNNIGPSLVPYGGTLGPTGYSFGPNTGLSLSNAVTTNGPYSIDIRSYFDSFTGVTNTGDQRILDFRNRSSDSGLYSYQNGSLRLLASSYAPGMPPSGPRLNDPTASSLPVFSPGTMADLLLTRDAAGLFQRLCRRYSGLQRYGPGRVHNVLRPQQHHLVLCGRFSESLFLPEYSRSRFRLYRLHQRVRCCCYAYSGCCSNYSVCSSNSRHTPTGRHRPWPVGVVPQAAAEAG